MISISGITKTYHTGDVETQALKNVSFRVAKGEFVAVMGPSGSGKSTLMHILGCLDTPTEGSYVLDGSDVSDLKDDALAQIRMQKVGFVFQSFNLLPRSTVLRNVMLPLRYRGDHNAKERSEAVLQSVGLEEKFESKPNQLSGGEAQRVAIARALVADPAIILADEPTGNLDTATSKDIMAIFKNLNEAGRTIIVITHERDVAAYAGRTITLRDGEIESDVLRT